MNTMASRITGVSIVHSNVCSGADQRKHQSSASLAFVRGIHRSPVNSPHKRPVTRIMFPFDDVTMISHLRAKRLLLPWFLPGRHCLCIPVDTHISAWHKSQVHTGRVYLLYIYPHRPLEWNIALQWRHNDHDGVTNHKPHDCLLNRSFRRRSKKTSKFRVTGLCEGNSPVTSDQ